MAFYRHPDGICRINPVPGAAKMAKRPFPPGYVDPEPIQRHKRYLILKWTAQGKKITQWSHALALAIARHHYYAPPMPRYQLSWRRANARKRMLAHPEWAAKGRAVVAARREIRKQQQARVGQGRAIQRQFSANTEGI